MLAVWVLGLKDPKDLAGGVRGTWLKALGGGSGGHSLDSLIKAAKLYELFNRSTESAHPTNESVDRWNPIASVVQQKYPPAGLPLASTARYRSAVSLAQCGLDLMRC